MTPTITVLHHINESQPTGRASMSEMAPSKRRKGRRSCLTRRAQGEGGRGGGRVADLFGRRVGFSGLLVGWVPLSLLAPVCM